MILGLEPWVFWLILMAVLLLIEVLTVNLVSIWFAGGALAAMIASFLGASVLLQIIIAVAISGVLLAAVLIFKPFDSAKNAQPPRTNSDRVIGEAGIVLERIDDVEGKGLVKVMGQTWSAVSQDGTAIEKNAEVRICAISGVKLVVERI